MGKLSEKTAVITGGSTGIGRATAKRFVAEGAKVFITGRRQAELDNTVGEIGGDVTERAVEDSALVPHALPDNGHNASRDPRRVVARPAEEVAA